MDKQILDDYTAMLQSKYDPYYFGFLMHPEEGRESKINDELQNIKNDLVQIDTALVAAGDQIYKLMTNTILRLDNIHANIMTEKERYQDMQMLCNKYNDYDNVKLLDDTSFKGSFVYDDGTFSPYRTSTKSVKLAVLDVAGNGYEGNNYVYKDYIFTNTIVNSSIRNNMIDDKLTSYYEYSRITVGNDEDIDNEDFNKDNIEAQCTISFQAEEGINEIQIMSDDTNIEITNVSYSTDGVEYVDMKIPYISINNKLDSYENYGYIYGSGKIVFPQKTALFKVTFKSKGYKNDQIAYEKMLINIEDFDETGIEMTPEVDEVITIVKSAKRHAIKINGIVGNLYQYIPKTKIQTHELLSQEVNAISLFANVYVPQSLDDDAVKFILTVNGKDYEVVPINSHLNGTKIIRFSTGNNSSPYTERLGEKIKSASLSVIFKNTAKAAPYINNVKILIGGEL
jgi:hypothetical protein